MLASPILDQLRRIETSTGAAAWRRLAWDTEQFGFPAARLERLEASGPFDQARRVKRNLLGLVLEECRFDGIRHLTARVEAGDFSAIHALEEAGFVLIDGIHTFVLRLDKVDAPAPAGTRMFCIDDLQAVLDIARTSFVYDRFHADPSLEPGTADRVNVVWTRNCCAGTAADAVLIAEEQGRVASYVAGRVDRKANQGVIVLVATAEWARRRGAARRATLAALHWFLQQGAEAVEVGTQLSNTPAARLYESLGFRTAATSLTLRILL